MKNCLPRVSLSSSCWSRRPRVPQARANVKLPKVIDSHMVLQRDRPLPIWGWADPGEAVAVRWTTPRPPSRPTPRATGTWCCRP